MEPRSKLGKALVAAIAAAMFFIAGCPGGRPLVYQRPSSAPLGSLSDPVWQRQEGNAERSDFVIHEHEFCDASEVLNMAGEDHVKQIAARLASGQDTHVIVERSRNYARPETEYKYPVHPNPDLDMRRRELVVRCLVAMRVPDADVRVVVAPDLAPEYRAGEIEATYVENGNNNRNNNGYNNGWGGGYGGGYGGGFGGGYGGGIVGAGGNPGSADGGNVASSGGGTLR